MGKLLERRTKREPIPELRDGDRLDTAEFLRRYEATPEGFRAELINGVVYVNRWIEVGPNGEERVMPPISGGGRGHAGPQMTIIGAFANYMAGTQGADASAPATLVLSPVDSAPEPDAMMRILSECDGASYLGDDQYYHGPPELVVEIARSTVKIDLGSKFDMYERNGVQEYVVWRVRQGVIDWFQLERGEYQPIEPDADGILKSRVFPGLWLDPKALIAGDMAKVLAVVQRGIASPEHAKFVEKLRKKAAKKKR